MSLTRALPMLLIFAFLWELCSSAAYSCQRPKDMSNTTAVTSWWQCLQQQNKQCRSKRSAGACRQQKFIDYDKRFPSNVKEIDPTTRCRIANDGSYQCQLDPVRFLVKETITPTTEPSPSVSPGESPTGASDETGNSPSDGGGIPSTPALPAPPAGTSGGAQAAPTPILVPVAVPWKK